MKELLNRSLSYYIISSNYPDQGSTGSTIRAGSTCPSSMSFDTLLEYLDLIKALIDNSDILLDKSQQTLHIYELRYVCGRWKVDLLNSSDIRGLIFGSEEYELSARIVNLYEGLK